MFRYVCVRCCESQNAVSGMGHHPFGTRALYDVVLFGVNLNDGDGERGVAIISDKLRTF